MWVDLKDNNQVAVIGARSKAFGIGKKKSKNKSKLSEMILSNFSHMLRTTRKKNLEPDRKFKKQGNDDKKE